MVNKKSIFMLLVVSILAISVVSAFWPFGDNSITGNAVKLPSRSTFCEDSDLGMNSSVAGAVNYQFRRLGITSTRSAGDSCEDKGKSLIEYYCDDEKVKKREVSCQYGCENSTSTLFGQTLDVARCKDQTTTPPTTGNSACTDSDGGVNASKGGYVVIGKVNGEDFAADGCSSTGKLTEYSCGSDGKIKSSEISCSGSNAGKCVTINVTRGNTNVPVGQCTPQPSSCSDTDATQAEPNKVAGTVSATDVTGKSTTESDRCTGSKNLVEYSCANNQINTTTVVCSDVCREGKCEDRNTLCTDSDDGKNYAIKGEVITKKADGTNITVISDFCLDENRLLELGCYSFKNENVVLLSSSKLSSRIGAKSVSCKNGCVNGACRSAEVTAETDSTAA